MLNIHKKLIVLSHGIIWPNKKYGEYVTRKENAKANNYMLQAEEYSYNWAHVQMYVRLSNYRIMVNSIGVRSLTNTTFVLATKA